MSKASVEALEALHGTVARELSSRITSADAKPADFANAIKFLKDNGIEQLPTGGNDVSDLLKDLPFDAITAAAAGQH
ncbi:hypothetical protein [Bacterioplanoides sp.]|uniref:hypothetical protein n=1 Tax=Bacterioplanoides sp. TaxID=2066072 RepID=UPI003B00838E